MDDVRPLLVGLHNPLSPDPRDALAPFPRGCAGERLASMILQADATGTFGTVEYEEAFDRMNLWRARALPSGLGAGAAFSAAGEAVVAECAGRRDVVLLGTRVWSAVMANVPHPMGRPGAPSFFEHREVRGTRFWRFPHPSGRNLIYNRPAQRQRAGEILLALARGKMP